MPRVKSKHGVFKRSAAVSMAGSRAQEARAAAEELEAEGAVIAQQQRRAADRAVRKARRARKHRQLGDRMEDIDLGPDGRDSGSDFSEGDSVSTEEEDEIEEQRRRARAAARQKRAEAEAAAKAQQLAELESTRGAPKRTARRLGSPRGDADVIVHVPGYEPAKTKRGVSSVQPPSWKRAARGVMFLKAAGKWTLPGVDHSRQHTPQLISDLDSPYPNYVEHALQRVLEKSTGGRDVRLRMLHFGILHRLFRILAVLNPVDLGGALPADQATPANPNDPTDSPAAPAILPVAQIPPTQSMAANRNQAIRSPQQPQFRHEKQTEPSEPVAQSAATRPNYLTKAQRIEHHRLIHAAAATILANLSVEPEVRAVISGHIENVDDAHAVLGGDFAGSTMAVKTVRRECRKQSQLWFHQLSGALRHWMDEVMPDTAAADQSHAGALKAFQARGNWAAMFQATGSPPPEPAPVDTRPAGDAAPGKTVGAAVSRWAKVRAAAVPTVSADRRTPVEDHLQQQRMFYTILSLLHVVTNTATNPLCRKRMRRRGLVPLMVRASTFCAELAEQAEARRYVRSRQGLFMSTWSSPSVPAEDDSAAHRALLKADLTAAVYFFRNVADTIATGLRNAAVDDQLADEFMGAEGLEAVLKTLAPVRPKLAEAVIQAAKAELMQPLTGATKGEGGKHQGGLFGRLKAARLKLFARRQAVSKGEEPSQAAEVASPARSASGAVAKAWRKAVLHNDPTRQAKQPPQVEQDTEETANEALTDDGAGNILGGESELTDDGAGNIRGGESELTDNGAGNIRGGESEFTDDGAGNIRGGESEFTDNGAGSIRGGESGTELTATATEHEMPSFIAEGSSHDSEAEGAGQGGGTSVGDLEGRSRAERRNALSLAMVHLLDAVLYLCAHPRCVDYVVACDPLQHTIVELLDLALEDKALAGTKQAEQRQRQWDEARSRDLSSAESVAALAPVVQPSESMFVQPLPIEVGVPSAVHESGVLPPDDQAATASRISEMVWKLATSGGAVLGATLDRLVASGKHARGVAVSERLVPVALMVLQAYAEWCLLLNERVVSRSVDEAVLRAIDIYVAGTLPPEASIAAVKDVVRTSRLMERAMAERMGISGQPGSLGRVTDPTASLGQTEQSIGGAEEPNDLLLDESVVYLAEQPSVQVAYTRSPTASFQVHLFVVRLLDILHLAMDRYEQLSTVADSGDTIEAVIAAMRYHTQQRRAEVKRLRLKQLEATAAAGEAEHEAWLKSTVPGTAAAEGKEQEREPEVKQYESEAVRAMEEETWSDVASVPAGSESGDDEEDGDGDEPQRAGPVDPYATDGNTWMASETLVGLKHTVKIREAVLQAFAGVASAVTRHRDGCVVWCMKRGLDVFVSLLRDFTPQNPVCVSLACKALSVTASHSVYFAEEVERSMAIYYTTLALRTVTAEERKRLGQATSYFLTQISGAHQRLRELARAKQADARRLTAKKVPMALRVSKKASTLFDKFTKSGIGRAPAADAIAEEDEEEEGLEDLTSQAETDAAGGATAESTLPPVVVPHLRIAEFRQRLAPSPVSRHPSLTAASSRMSQASLYRHPTAAAEFLRSTQSFPIRASVLAAAVNGTVEQSGHGAVGADDEELDLVRVDLRMLGSMRLALTAVLATLSSYTFARAPLYIARTLPMLAFQAEQALTFPFASYRRTARVAAVALGHMCRRPYMRVVVSRSQCMRLFTAMLVDVEHFDVPVEEPLFGYHRLRRQALTASSAVRGARRRLGSEESELEDDATELDANDPRPWWKRAVTTRPSAEDTVASSRETVAIRQEGPPPSARVALRGLDSDIPPNAPLSHHRFFSEGVYGVPPKDTKPDPFAPPVYQPRPPCATSCVMVDAVTALNYVPGLQPPTKQSRLGKLREAIGMAAKPNPNSQSTLDKAGNALQKLTAAEADTTGATAGVPHTYGDMADYEIGVPVLRLSSVRAEICYFLRTVYVRGDAFLPRIAKHASLRPLTYVLFYHAAMRRRIFRLTSCQRVGHEVLRSVWHWVDQSRLQRALKTGDGATPAPPASRASTARRVHEAMRPIPSVSALRQAFEQASGESITALTATYPDVMWGTVQWAAQLIDMLSASLVGDPSGPRYKMIVLQGKISQSDIDMPALVFFVVSELFFILPSLTNAVATMRRQLAEAKLADSHLQTASRQARMPAGVASSAVDHSVPDQPGVSVFDAARLRGDEALARDGNVSPALLDIRKQFDAPISPLARATACATAFLGAFHTIHRLLQVDLKYTATRRVLRLLSYFIQTYDRIDPDAGDVAAFIARNTSDPSSATTPGPSASASPAAGRSPAAASSARSTTSFAANQKRRGGPANLDSANREDAGVVTSFLLRFVEPGNDILGATRVIQAPELVAAGWVCAGLLPTVMVVVKLLDQLSVLHEMKQAMGEMGGIGMLLAILSDHEDLLEELFQDVPDPADDPAVSGTVSQSLSGAQSGPHTDPSRDSRTAGGSALVKDNEGRRGSCAEEDEGDGLNYDFRLMGDDSKQEQSTASQNPFGSVPSQPQGGFGPVRSGDDLEREYMGALVSILAKVAADRSLTDLVVAAGGVPTFVRLLSIRRVPAHSPLKTQAANALCGLCTENDGSAQEAADYGGIPPLVEVVRAGTQEGRASAVAALRVIVSQPGVQVPEEDVLECIPKLVGVLDDGSDQAKVWMGRILLILCDTEPTHHALIDAGACPHIARLLHASTPEGKQVGVDLARMLIRYPESHKPLTRNGAVGSIVSILRSHVPSLITRADCCHILARLALDGGMGKEFMTCGVLLAVSSMLNPWIESRRAHHSFQRSVSTASPVRRMKELQASRMARTVGGGGLQSDSKAGVGGPGKLSAMDEDSTSFTVEVLSTGAHTMRAFVAVLQPLIASADLSALSNAAVTPAGIRSLQSPVMQRRAAETPADRAFRSVLQSPVAGTKAGLSMGMVVGEEELELVSDASRHDAWCLQSALQHTLASAAYLPTPMLYQQLGLPAAAENIYDLGGLSSATSGAAGSMLSPVRSPHTARPSTAADKDVWTGSAKTPLGSSISGVMNSHTEAERPPALAIPSPSHSALHLPTLSARGKMGGKFIPTVQPELVIDDDAVQLAMDELPLLLDVQLRAVEAVTNIAASDEECRAVLAAGGAPKTLLRMLRVSTRPDVRRDAAGALYVVAAHESCQQQLRVRPAVRLLMHRMRGADAETRLYLSGTLYFLSLHTHTAGWIGTDDLMYSLMRQAHCDLGLMFRRQHPETEMPADSDEEEDVLFNRCDLREEPLGGTGTATGVGPGHRKDRQQAASSVGRGAVGIRWLDNGSDTEDRSTASEEELAFNRVRTAGDFSIHLSATMHALGVLRNCMFHVDARAALLDSSRVLLGILMRHLQFLTTTLRLWHEIQRQKEKLDFEEYAMQPGGDGLSEASHPSLYGMAHSVMSELAAAAGSVGSMPPVSLLVGLDTYLDDVEMALEHTVGCIWGLLVNPATDFAVQGGGGVGMFRTLSHAVTEEFDHVSQIIDGVPYEDNEFAGQLHDHAQQLYSLTIVAADVGTDATVLMSKRILDFAEVQYVHQQRENLSEQLRERWLAAARR